MAKDKSINDFLSKLGSSSITYDDLVEIKSNVVNTKEGIKLIAKHNLLKGLVNLLDKPNEKIIDMALSILGNCSLDEDSRKEVVCHGIVKKLSYLLHNIAKDSIQCRACRLAGNLAQVFSVAEDLAQERSVIDIVTMLDSTSKSSIATKQMAVRALRLLWCVEDQWGPMLKLKVVRAVTLLLNVNQKKTEDRELLKGVIKALLVFSANHSLPYAEKSCGEDSTFKQLVTLTSDATLKKSVLMIICNLSHTRNARPGLGSVDAVRLIINELKNHEESDLGLFTEMVRALCLFCNESVNRAAIRYAGGLPLLLKIIRTTSTTSLSPFLLHALEQFMYDDVSLQELSKEGLVPILVEKIASFVKDHGKGHQFVNATQENYYEIVEFHARCTYQCGRSWKRRCESESPNGKSSFSTEYYCIGNWSPGSPSSICCSPDASPHMKRFWGGSQSNSSGFSPNTSPNARDDEEFDYPEAYSPICSDEEDDPVINVNINSRNDDDDCDEIVDVEAIDDEDFVPYEEVPEKSVTALKQEQNILSPALVLLSRLSCMDTPMDDLASDSTLNALLDYMTCVDNPEPRAQRILYRIIRNHHYLVLLLQNKFIFSIQSKLFYTKHNRCKKCLNFRKIGLHLYSDIRDLAQSGFGEGELAHQLLKAEESMKRILAISVPYIIIMKRLLVKFLMECGGLKTLLDILKTDVKEDDDLIVYLPMSLRLLGSAVKLPMPCSNNKEMGRHEFNEEYPENIDTEMPPITKIKTNKVSDDTIFLLLDDGNAVKVSKSYLSLQSPMFEAMFRGDFKESQEERVPLPGISLDCLISLFRIIRHGRVPQLMPGIDLNVSLELVAMLDRFLIPGSEDISKIIVERFLTMDTALQIYSKCIEAGDVLHFHKLRHETVRFIIMSGEPSPELNTLFKGILKSPYKLQMAMDITDIFEERLR